MCVECKIQKNVINHKNQYYTVLYHTITTEPCICLIMWHKNTLILNYFTLRLYKSVNVFHCVQQLPYQSIHFWHLHIFHSLFSKALPFNRIHYGTNHSNQGYKSYQGGNNYISCIHWFLRFWKRKVRTQFCIYRWRRGESLWNIHRYIFKLR